MDSFIHEFWSCLAVSGCSDVSETILLTLAIVPQMILAVGVVKTVFNLEEKYSNEAHFGPVEHPAPAG